MVQALSPRQASRAAIGARLRRLSERIDREASAVYAARGVVFEQRWYGALSLLDERGPLSVSEIAEALNVTHAAVSQVRQSLSAAELINAAADPADRRRRALCLTAKGEALVDQVRPLWEALEAVGAAINREADDPAAALDRLESALDRMSIAERIEGLIGPEA